MIGLGAVIATLSAQALAAFVVNAWFGGAYDGDKHAVSAFTLVAVTLIAYLFPRVLAGFEIDGRSRHVISAAITYVVVYGVIRIEFAGDFAIWDLSWVADFLDDPSATLEAGTDAFIGSLFVIGCWSWGLFRSSEEVDLEFIPKALGGPFGVVTLVVILASPSPAIGEVARGAIAFYAVAVLALALSSLARSGATIGNVRAGGITATLLAGITGVTIVCVIVAGLVWGPLAGPIGTVLSATIEVVLTVVLTPILWTMEKIMRFLLGGSGALDEVREIPDQAAGDPSEPNDERSNFRQLSAYAFRLLALALVAGGIYLFLAFMTRLRKRTPQADAPADRSRVGSLRDDLRKFARGLVPSWHRGYGAPPDSDAVRLYVDVLRKAESQGHPRGTGTTPEEFAPELSSTFATEVTDDITAVFEDARYGDKPVASDRVRELQRRWQERLRAAEAEKR